MKYGFNLLLWATHVTSEHYPILGKLKTAGYDGVEIPLFEGDAKYYQALGKEVKNQGLVCSSLVTVATPDASPISPDAGVRKAGLDRLKWAIDCTAASGAEMLCGPYHSPLAVFTGLG